uniref:BFN domain-containing protein n=1 Tax=Physcomitrium patens TaxID=3218 RepID=A0A7I3ZTL9_PHYPA
MAAPAAAMSLLPSHSPARLHRSNVVPCSLMSTPRSMRATPLGNCALSVPFPAAMKPRSTKFSTSRNSSDSAESDSVAENFSENDEDYADSTIVEAVEVRSGPEGCTIKMRNGDVLKCVHNSNEAGTLPVYDPHPAIVLHLNDSSNLLLPIIVLEFPSAMLSDAIRNVEPTRPTVYQVMSNILEVSGYKAKLVRVTKRVNETYFARVHLVKEGDDSAPPMSLDIRPSDAINLAVRCKIPIQVTQLVLISSLNRSLPRCSSCCASHVPG